MLRGRARELAELVGRGRSLADGSGFGVVVQGPAGIGKSALLSALAVELGGIVTVLQATGSPVESELDFAGLGELLLPLLPLLGLLVPRHRRALGAALALDDHPVGSDLEVFAATTALLDVGAARRPVLCLVDDAHALDRGSLDALLFASRRLRGSAVGFVLAGRDEPLPRLDAAPLARLALAGLDRADAAALVRGTEPGLDAAAVARVVDESAGYPLALVELARTAARSPGGAPLTGPLPAGERMVQVYGEQARALPAPTRDALVVVAAAEVPLRSVVERATVGLCGSAVALDAALDSGLVRVDGDRYAFRHPLARSAVYHSATQAQRRTAHTALARVLARERPDLAAWHHALGATGPDEDVAAGLEQAAAAARRRGGRSGEARALELAARLSPDPDRATARLLACGVAAQQAGRPELARDALDRVVARSADPLVLADAHHHLAQLEFWRDGRVPASLLPAAADVEALDPVRAARLVSFALVPLLSDCRVADALPLAERAWALTRGAARPFDVAVRVAHVLVLAGDPRGADLAARTAAAAEAEGDALAMVMVSQPLWWLERTGEARRLLELAVAEARGSDALWVLAHGLINLAELERRCGRPLLARAAAAEAVGLAEALGEPLQHAEALVQLAAAEAQTGEPVQARAHAEQALRQVRSRSAGATELRLTAAEALARADLTAGDPGAAVRELGPVLTRVMAAGVVDPALVPAVADLLDALLALGRVEEAARVESWLAERAERCDRGWARLVVARSAAVRSPREGTEALRDALEAGPDDGVLAGRGWLTYGELVRRSGERRQAREALERASELLHAAGASAWFERVADELRACGAASGPGSTVALTPQEERIARLASSGSRNREIAQALHVSEKTVESHLAAVFRKLGVRSRTELAGRFPREP